MANTKGETLLRYASIGVGYGGYLQIGAWMANHLAQEIDDLTFWIDFHITAKWFRKGEQLLQHGGADLGLFNTRGVAAMALRGNGLYSEPFPELRAIAAFPHYDWLLFAVDQSLGVRTFAELKQRKVPLKLTTGFLDGDNVVGWFAVELLKRHGISLEEFRSWGGEILPLGINQTFQALREGKANAICQEGVFSKGVQEQFAKRPMFCLPTDPHVLKAFQDEFGWGALTVPANFYVGQTAPLVAPDFSEWLLCSRADLDAELAYKMARIVVEKAPGTSEGTLAGANKRIVVAVPQPLLDPKKAVDTSPVKLHPGAEKLYRERGLL